MQQGISCAERVAAAYRHREMPYPDVDAFLAESRLRRKLSPLREPRLLIAAKRHGIEAVNRALLRQTYGLERTLRNYGAHVAGGGVIHGPLVIHNADPDYRNLDLGWKVHIGRGVFFDLTEKIIIEEDVTVSMGALLLTHTDIGDRPLAAHMPRRTAHVVIGQGAYIGARAMIFPGCHVGEMAVVGAGAVVTKPVPDGDIVVGVPARKIGEVPD